VVPAIGHPDPVSVHIDTFGTATVSENKITRAINRTFSFQPSDIIDQLNLRRPIYGLTTNYGHFGKKGLTWEETNKTGALLKAL
jgi:S-adenosylmethionine synthetase